MTVAELEERLTLREYWDWMEFTKLEPFTPERVDLAGALIASTLVNLNKRKGAKAAQVDDFMLISRGLREHYNSSDPASEEDRAGSLMRRVIAGLGGKV